MNGSFSVTFWGVRGSHPAPGPRTVRYGGNTASVEVRAGNHLIILDAGTGIIELGRKLVAQSRGDQKPITAILLFTHTHHDHTQGFPFFVPAFFQSSTFYIFGPKTLHQDLEEVLSRTMMPPVFPITLEELPCERETRNLHEAEVILLDADSPAPRVVRSQRDASPPSPEQVRIHVMRSYAHPQGVFIYRIEYAEKALVLATDTEGYLSGDQRLIRFARGAQLLVHDAQYSNEEYGNAGMPKQGWGHSTWQMAVEVAQRAGVERLVFYHHDPAHSDDLLAKIEQEAQQIFPGATMGCEGLTIEL
ncbi:MAG: MBL fold metallo-hydrolase [Chloroflexi bacterium]|nr:MBL fold metallo-hydrolase [Chloroflexota bacterium]